MEGFPTTRPTDVLALVATVLRARLRPGGDKVRAIREWADRESGGRGGVIINLGVKKLLLITSPELSAHVLERRPASDGYSVGKLKQSGMAFLAPRALTISNGDDWTRRRRFNEQVLDTGHPHDLRQAFLQHVTAAFASPVTDPDDVRRRMGDVMLGVVVGSAPGGALPDEVDRLMTVVRNPVKRKLFGWCYRRRRERFYDTLAGHWAQAPDPSLIASARTLASGDLDGDEGIEQVPHWMFTFTGSGTDLLSRTLALVGSRPDVRERVVDEVTRAGSIDDAATVDGLTYVEACLRETGRLYPPVTTTFHVAPNGDEYEGHPIPAGMEIVHYFPMLSGDGKHGTAHDFRPERRGAAGETAPGVTSNLFLSGARACPGEDLMMFVCKAAVALAIGTQGLRSDAPRLADDPLPGAFPAKDVRFHV